MINFCPRHEDVYDFCLICEIERLEGVNQTSHETLSAIKESVVNNIRNVQRIHPNKPHILLHYLDWIVSLALKDARNVGHGEEPITEKPGPE